MKPAISLADRFEHGNITIRELSELSGRCRASIYNDIKAGILQVRRLGAKRKAVYVPGPVAREYIVGWNDNFNLQG